MTNVYVYKLTTDDGGAPCVKRGILSLAICKPAIRSTAQRNNIILGFSADSLYPDNRLVYAAKVTSHIDARDYFSMSEYATRPDCVYSWDGSKFHWKPGAKYHSEGNLEHDLGEPPGYNRAHVLVSGGLKISDKGVSS